MCNKCKKLVECPVGEKRVVTLGGDGKENVKIEMVLDRYKDHTDAFIHAEYAGDMFWKNMPFSISYCPFCGEQLV